MNDQIIVGIASSVGVAIGLVIHQSRQNKKNNSLAVRIGAALREKGPRTLRELSEDLAMTGLMGRGNIFNALTAMTQRGAVAVIEAPAGTPQLKKVDFIRYRLSEAPAPTAAG